MHEQIGRNPEADYDARLGNNYLTSHNVRARFFLYEFGDPSLDIEEKALAALLLDGSENIVDLGTADGSFLRRLRVEQGHEGNLIGIEPHATQFSNEPVWQSVDPELLARKMKLFFGDSTLATAENIQRYIDSGLPRLGSNELELRKGSAINMPLKDNTADILCAMFMMYHVTVANQPAAFKEIKRVLQPEGTFVMTTSGANNKSQHRLFEEDIAQKLNIIAPEPMNTGLTTDKAEILLPKHFGHVYAYKYSAKMIIKDALSVRAYLSSQLSLRDQYRPIPDEDEFKSYMHQVIVPELNQAIRKHGAFKDNIERSIFICSDRELTVRTDGFTKIA